MTEREVLEPLVRELDRHAAELLARAANLDYLAGVIEARTCELDRRERELAQREEDVLMASRELKRRYKPKENIHAA